MKPSADKLEEIFRLQRELNDKTFAKGHDAKHPYFVHFDSSPTIKHDYSFSFVCQLAWHHPIRQYWIGKFMQACFAEIGEMHETTAWKWWRPVEAVVGVDLPSTLDGTASRTQQNARIEGIDTLHFLVSLFLLMGLDAKGAHEMYVGKHKVNEQRQESGYTEKKADDTHVQPSQHTGL